VTPHHTLNASASSAFSLVLLALVFLGAGGPRASAQAFPLYVTNIGNNTLERFDSAGVGTAFSSNLNQPFDLAFDLRSGGQSLRRQSRGRQHPQIQPHRGRAVIHLHRLCRVIEPVGWPGL